MSGAAGTDRPAPGPADGGLLLVDKPSGVTSHDVVGRVRRILHTRRVGHAGTLDPMATGLLVLAVDRATRLLGHLALTDKAYRGTIRLGQASTTDDAEGTLTVGAHPERLISVSAVSDTAIDDGIAALTGDLQQRPSTYSAIKVDGRRAYERARGGEAVRLEARPVTVRRFEVVGPIRRPAEVPGGAGSVVPVIDLDVIVECTTGTYVRALARDLGASLGVGGHLIALRRTRVGPFDLGSAVEVFDDDPAALETRVRGALVPAAAAVRRAFPVRMLDAADAEHLRHGRPIAGAGIAGVYAAFASDGPRRGAAPTGSSPPAPSPGADAFVALVRERDSRAGVVLGWAAGAPPGTGAEETPGPS